MLGSQQNPGLINLSLRDIFKQKEIFENDYKVEINVSYVEIYNEILRDLLVEKSTKVLDLWDHPSKGVTLSNATVISVENTETIM